MLHLKIARSRSTDHSYTWTFKKFHYRWLGVWNGKLKQMFDPRVRFWYLLFKIAFSTQISIQWYSCLFSPQNEMTFKSFSLTDQKLICAQASFVPIIILQNRSSWRKSQTPASPRGYVGQLVAVVETQPTRTQHEEAGKWSDFLNFPRPEQHRQQHLLPWQVPWCL